MRFGHVLEYDFSLARQPHALNAAVGFVRFGFDKAVGREARSQLRNVAVGDEQILRDFAAGFTLEDVGTALGVKKIENRHNAIVDCQYEAEIFRALVKKLKV